MNELGPIDERPIVSSTRSNLCSVFFDSDNTAGGIASICDVLLLGKQ